MAVVYFYLKMPLEILLFVKAVNKIKMEKNCFFFIYFCLKLNDFLFLHLSPSMSILPHYKIRLGYNRWLN